MESNDMSRILVIEDELPMRTALKACLGAEGYRVLTAADGQSGLQRALEDKPDLILLDIMMPKLDGYAVVSELRRFDCNIPILMLTAKGQIGDRVIGLDAGADDYLVKPFSTEEMLARIRAALRRTRKQMKTATKLTLGEVEIDFVRHEATRKNQPLHLTAREFSILRLLLNSEGEPVSRERFLDVVWGYTALPTTRTVDNCIVKLREKIEPNSQEPSWIKTVHGVGYKLERSEK